MTFYVELEVEATVDFSIQEVGEKIIRAVLEIEDCPYEIECNLLITDKEGIREHNKEYRKIDASTDVLSFPAMEFQEPSNFSFLEGQERQGEYFNWDSGELILGDIMISYDTMIEQAREYGHSVLREFAFLMVHSMLHLVGYDHIEEIDRLEMEAKQKKVLELLGIGREL
ncbi:MAG: rRNA maturation RNase YbeY [Eubacteriales bacterium]